MDKLGGIVARAAFMLPNYLPDSIAAILSFGSPHQAQYYTDPPFSPFVD